MVLSLGRKNPSEPSDQISGVGEGSARAPSPSQAADVASRSVSEHLSILCCWQHPLYLLSPSPTALLASALCSPGSHHRDSGQCSVMLWVTDVRTCVCSLLAAEVLPQRASDTAGAEGGAGLALPERKCPNSAPGRVPGPSDVSPFGMWSPNPCLLPGLGVPHHPPRAAVSLPLSPPGCAEEIPNRAKEQRRLARQVPG